MKDPIVVKHWSPDIRRLSHLVKDLFGMKVYLASDINSYMPVAAHIPFVVIDDALYCVQ